ncbi:MAG: cupredoxin domain-containing protein [Gemmatimonadales bacterium]
MRTIVFLVTVLLVAAPFTFGAAAQDAAALQVAHDPAVGAFLTDAAGKTLYLFTKDTTAGKSACTDQCAQNWPPLTAQDGMALPAGVPGTLGTIQRADGTKQVTYNDIPLYTYAKDNEAGDVYGQGAGGVWFIVPPGAQLGSYPAATGQGTPVPDTTVHIGFTEELGPFLIDSNGKAVYLFTKDVTAGQSTCTADCAKSWPAVPATAMMQLPAGIQGTLTAITRPDGTKQLAYNDIPLYFYAKDNEPGDTYGQAVGDVWYIVTPGMHFGDQPHTAKAAPSEAATPGSGTPSTAASGQTVQVSLIDLQVVPSRTTFQVGVPYTFVVTNNGQVQHEMVIEHKGDVDKPLAAGGQVAEAADLDPGQSKTVTWTFTEPGAYQLSCHKPGHFEAGMAIPIDVAS